MMKGEKQQVTLLLAGSVGSGKSSVGNAILDAATKPTSRRFQVGMGSGVTTVQCKEVESEWKGLKFTIVDTPDCSHLRFEQHENTDEVERTAKLSLERATAIVFVIRVDERFTPTKLDVYKDLRTYRKPIIPVFTMKEKFSVDDILKDKDPSLVNIQTVLKDTGQTYVVFGAIGAGRSKENKVGVGKLFQILEEKGIIQPLSSVFTGNLHPIFGAGNTSTKTSNQNKGTDVSGCTPDDTGPPASEAGDRNPTDTERYRLLLVGKIDHGKSALGNSILKWPNRFPVGRRWNDGTRHCMIARKNKFEVVDTPEFTGIDQKDTDILQEISKYIKENSPPHAVLMVLRFRLSDYNDDEYSAYFKLKPLLGDDMASRTIVVFTVSKSEKIDMDKKIQEERPKFKDMMAEISNRYLIININEKGEENKKQLSALVKQIQNLELARDHAGSGMQENV